MTNEQNATINNLFNELERMTVWADSLNHRALFSEDSRKREGCDIVFGEALEEIAKIQKRLVRQFLQSGDYGISELLDHIDVGTLPERAIQAAMGRYPERSAA